MSEKEAEPMAAAVPDADLPHDSLARIRRFHPSFTLSFLQNSDDSVSILSVDGTIEFMNVKGLRLLGFERADDIAGLRWDILWPSQARGKALVALERAAAGLTAHYGSALGYLNAPEARVLVTLSPLFRPETGAVDAIMAVARPD